MEEGTGLRYPHAAMTRNRVLDGDIETLWTRYSKLMEPSRKRIGACADTRNGVQQFKLPGEFDIPGAENLIVSLPQKMTVPLRTANVLARKQPRLQRYQVGNTLKAGLVAGNIETWVNAAIEKKTNWGELIGKLFLDGECAVMVVPSLADWKRSPDFMDSLSAEEFGLLDEETQERYRRCDEYGDPLEEDDEEEDEAPRKGRSRVSVKQMNPGLRDDDEDARYVRVDDDGEPVPHERYWRDSFKSPDYPYGRTADDPYYETGRRKFKEHRKHTEKAFEVEQQHWLKDNLPFRVTVVSAKDCVPIFDVDQKLKGLVIKREFTREMLLENNYVWDEDPTEMLVPSETEGQGGAQKGEVTLYEYWGLDADGTPYVSYTVNGLPTRFKTWGGARQPASAVINLRREFGLRSLPVMYCWGLHWETDEVSMKGVPFLWPVLGAITGVEALSTSILVHSYSTAFGSWGIHADYNIIRDFPELLADNGSPRSFKFAPLTTTILPGRPYPLVHPGVGKDVKDLLNMLMSASSSMAPSEIAFGGGNASSGHDRALSREYLETSMNQVLDGALKAYQFIGETILEICCGITKTTGVPVPVYATVPVPQTTGNKNRGKVERSIIELRPEWVGPIYNLVAFYPKSAGENMAELQQLAQLHLQGLVTFREFREKGFGDENPAATLIEIYTDQYLKSDAGKTEIAQLAAEMMGADAEAEKQKLVDEQRLTPGGTPTAALPPELQALNTGKIPPGVDPEMFLAKLSGMLAHDAARNALRPAGPLGPTGSIAQQAAMTASPTQPAGQVVPPSMGPAGAPGPAAAPGAGVNEAAPTLSGMSLPNTAAQAMGGEIAGEMGTASLMRDAAARAAMGS